MSRSCRPCLAVLTVKVKIIKLKVNIVGQLFINQKTDCNQNYHSYIMVECTASAILKFYGLPNRNWSRKYVSGLVFKIEVVGKPSLRGNEFVSGLTYFLAYKV